jgi:hypothetical protein
VTNPLHTHHEKLILCDDGLGEVVAFIGGIELAAGRYDAAEYAERDESGSPFFFRDLFFSFLNFRHLFIK